MAKVLILDENLTNDPSGNFTLLNIIPAKQGEFETFPTEAKVKIKQARRSVEIDQDVTDAFRKQFGNMPIGRAIRILVGLKPNIAQNAWQEEEDALIRENYPSTGAPPLAKVLERSVFCIRDRASSLGVKRVWLYKGNGKERRDRHSKRRRERRIAICQNRML